MVVCSRSRRPPVGDDGLAGGIEAHAGLVHQAGAFGDGEDFFRPGIGIAIFAQLGNRERVRRAVRTLPRQSGVGGAGVGVIVVGLITDLPLGRIGVVTPGPDQVEVAGVVQTRHLPIGTVVGGPASAFDEGQLSRALVMNVMPTVRGQAVTVEKHIAVAGGAFAEKIQQIAVGQRDELRIGHPFFLAGHGAIRPEANGVGPGDRRGAAGIMKGVAVHAPAQVQIPFPIHPHGDAIVAVGDVVGGEAGAENFPAIGGDRPARHPQRVVEAVVRIGLMPSVVGDELLVPRGHQGGADERRGVDAAARVGVFAGAGVAVLDRDEPHPRAGRMGIGIGRVRAGAEFLPVGEAVAVGVILRPIHQRAEVSDLPFIGQPVVVRIPRVGRRIVRIRAGEIFLKVGVIVVVGILVRTRRQGPEVDGFPHIRQTVGVFVGGNGRRVRWVRTAQIFLEVGVIVVVGIIIRSQRQRTEILQLPGVRQPVAIRVGKEHKLVRSARHAADAHFINQPHPVAVGAAGGAAFVADAPIRAAHRQVVGHPQAGEPIGLGPARLRPGPVEFEVVRRVRLSVVGDGDMIPIALGQGVWTAQRQRRLQRLDFTFDGADVDELQAGSRIIDLFPNHPELEEPERFFGVGGNDLHRARFVGRHGKVRGAKIRAHQGLQGEGAVGAGTDEQGIVAGAVHERQGTEIRVAAGDPIGIGGERRVGPAVVRAGRRAEARQRGVAERGAVGNGRQRHASGDGIGAMIRIGRFIEMPEMQRGGIRWIGRHGRQQRQGGNEGQAQTGQSQTPTPGPLLSRGR